MAWPAETLHLEVQAEFRALSGHYHFDRIVDALYVLGDRLREYHKQYENWWMRTPTGRASKRASARRQYAARSSVVVAVRGCVICRQPFPVTAEKARKRQTLVCSTACRLRHLIATRKTSRVFTIGGETMALPAWCKRVGINYGTAKCRLRKGWPIEKALGLEPQEGKP